jgi:hypothetical protein
MDGWDVAEQSQDVALLYTFFFFFVFHPAALCPPQHNEGGGGKPSFQNVALYDAQHRDAIDPATTEEKRKSSGACSMYK